MRARPSTGAPRRSHSQIRRMRESRRRLTPYGICMMSAIHRLPTVYLLVEAIRMELRLSPKLSCVELSTFMTAFPAVLIVTSSDDIAWCALT